MRAHFNVTLSKYSVDSAIEIWGKIEIKGTFLCQCWQIFQERLNDMRSDKLHVYNFDMASRKSICTKVCGRKNRVEVNSKYTSWEENFYSVPQGSILGSLTFPWIFT